MGETVYKICDAGAWDDARAAGRYTGSADDIRDGFIHLSAGAQLRETAAKHFAGQENLLLIKIDSDALGENLKWEVSRGGALFPHLYGSLEVRDVLSVFPLPLGPNGEHLFPEETVP
jgi:uncharacterized protein (DUF952 family)